MCKYYLTFLINRDLIKCAFHGACVEMFAVTTGRIAGPEFNIPYKQKYKQCYCDQTYDPVRAVWAEKYIK